MSLFIIFVKWLSITFADSSINFTGTLSKHAASSEFKELIILFTSWGVACGKLNLLFCVTDTLMAITLELSRYVSMIFPTGVSSSKRFP